MLEIIFGLISGIITGLGMGGGTILILFLSVFLNYDQHVAQAINLLFFIPTSIVAIIVNIKQKNIEYKVFFLIAIFGAIGTVSGVYLAHKISSIILKKIFGIFIFIIATHEIYVLFKQYIKTKKRHNK